jgi:simple sugar transport system ATP-binding protein
VSTLLELRNITKHFGPNVAVNDISMTIGEGEIVGLLGDNGAGKSTLVRIMSGVTAATNGEYLWRGETISKPTRGITENLGVETIFQDSALVDKLTITRNIFMGRELTNSLGLMKIKKMDEISSMILDAVVTIEGIRSPRQLVGSLSGGQKQAVAIARAVHFKRTLLILDEPTSALAVRATEALLRYLEQLRSEGVSSVLVTHNLHHAYRVCDRHIVMNRGRKILDVNREDTSVEELTAAVVEGSEGIDRLRHGQPLSSVRYVRLRPGERPRVAARSATVRSSSRRCSSSIRWCHAARRRARRAPLATAASTAQSGSASCRQSAKRQRSASVTMSAKARSRPCIEPSVHSDTARNPGVSTSRPPRGSASRSVAVVV